MQPRRIGDGPSVPARPAIILTVVAIVLALIGIGGVAFGAADKPAHHVAATGATTTTELSGDGGDLGGGDTGETSTTLAGGAPVSTTPTTVKGSPATGKSTCAAPPAASANPGANQATPIGTYSYVSCTDDKDVTETKIADGGSANGVTRRNVSEGASPVPQTTTLAYGPNGVLMEKLTVTVQGNTYTCDWNPDVVNYPPDLSVGKTWATKSSCDLKNGAAPIGKLSVDANGKVTDKVAVSVGGTTVNAWVIEGTVKLTTTSSFGVSTTNITSRVFLDPSRGLALYHNTQTQSDSGSQSREDRLVSLTPK